MKRRSLVFCALAAVVTAGVLAGCGNNYYFDGRVLPPSGIANRVLIAIQNPNPSTKGSLQFVDAYYDIRQSYNDKIPGFSISGYSGSLPSSIQNMPEEQLGAVYGSGDGSFSQVNYAKENSPGAAASFNGPSSSAFLGSVSSTCSNPSVARMAIRLPFSSSASIDIGVSPRRCPYVRYTPTAISALQGKTGCRLTTLPTGC